ncbi:ATP-binding protein [Clostridium butyricum]|uniref:ATP-binding protein n=3 Tax=Clostridium butyricum TaxID=1492 RepID=UPI0005EAFB11|nr:ATP-binding protein [Clostridium butyricum]MCQ2019638.1 ATP-binding protein [Clostridium butyricum]NFB72665.1 ATP-binding protein [Clostridium butyricum]NFB91457.1 ATP-binding protein [Clostridium butyricum]UTY53505.1 ATP-binding protein [Clostridium butyricum]
MEAIGLVYESSASAIIVKMDFKKFEANKSNLKIGKNLKISIGNHDYLIATIKNIKAVNDGDKDNYILSTEPVGTIIGENFLSGSTMLPSPTEEVFIADSESLKNIFINNEKYSFRLGKLVQNKDVDLFLDGNNFFGKHIGIVGSTGSGKSCAVAKILQEAVGIQKNTNINIERRKNSHIIIFDIHSEYKSAFSIDEKQNFSVNYLDVERLKLPYWLMNCEELETLFIESNESNSHNQISQFRKAVILNKEKYNPTLSKMTYDTPVYFNINEVYNYIYNLNEEVINKIAGEEQFPKIIENDKSTKLIKDKKEYFIKKYSFVPTSARKEDKASNGAFNGEFNRFIARLENKINDKRLEFLMKPLKEDKSEYKSEDFSEILKQFLGYLNKANVSIIDLSGIPFEVLSITVSLISRIVFDFAFHYSKLMHDKNKTNDVPFLIVCEEAHNYIPKNGGAEYDTSKKSIERIAKEGRKYGLSLMVVSQRPSEVSDTIFAQCNNFISLKLTNMSDQSYIKNLLPNNSNAIADTLPTLGTGECLVVGDATPISAIVKLDMPNPQPKSENVKVHDVWKEEWKEIDNKEAVETSIDDVLERWKNN